MTGMEEAGHFWLGSCVDLGMVCNSWEAKLQDMQQLMLFRYFQNIKS